MLLLFYALLMCKEWKKWKYSRSEQLKKKVNNGVHCCAKFPCSLLWDSWVISQLKLYSGPGIAQSDCKHFCVVSGTIPSFFILLEEWIRLCPFHSPAFPCCSTLRLFRSILQWIISAALLTTLAWNWQWGCLLFVWEQRTRERKKEAEKRVIEKR